MTPPAPFWLRTVRSDDGDRLRALRLQMLADTPMAYLESLQQARELDAAAWRERARLRCSPGNIGLVAVVPSAGEGEPAVPAGEGERAVPAGEGARWIGAMNAVVDAPASATIYGVFVAPDFRGTRAGVADALLGQLLDRLRAQGVVLARLEVHENNPRARAFYLRHGFVATGRRVPYAPQPSQWELEMVARLDGTPGG